MNSNVFYGIRMQRDMQRLGEVAGMAAAVAATNGAKGASRAVPVPQLQRSINGSMPANDEGDQPGPNGDDPIEHLKRGETGTPLWMIYRSPELYRDRVLHVLTSDESRASFYAACILAAWGDSRAEKRLLEAIAQREDGGVDPSENVGAYGQEIDIPFWLLATILLRCCGSERCVPVLVKLAANPDNILNVRSAIALTLERLVERKAVARADAEQIVDCLAQPIGDRTLTPSHSIARALRNQEQKQLTNHYIAPVREDHAWQLHLVLGRIRLKLGLDPHCEAQRYRSDERTFVRQAFAQLGL